MPRQPRAFVDGLPAHVTLRGVDRQDIFFLDGDRTRFLTFLKEGSERHGLAIHAYVLMSNHVHLLATPASPSSLPKVMQYVGRRYVAYFNRRNERTGTLWEGRYRAGLVDSGVYLMACHRYIELNPVRAGIVSDPREFHWSSFSANALARANALLAPHPEYLALAECPEKRCDAYRSLFEGEIDPEILEMIRACSRRGWPIGDDKFRAALECETGTQATPRRRGRKAKKKEADPNYRLPLA
jgi:putative transposase